MKNYKKIPKLIIDGIKEKLIDDPVAVTLLVVAPLLIKAFYVENFIFSDTSALMLGITQTIAHDSAIFFTAGLFFYVSYLKKVPYAISIALRIFALLIYIIYVIDFLIIMSFFTHLTINDTLKYYGYVYKYIQQIYSYKSVILFFCLFLLSVAFYVIILSRYKIIKIKTHKSSGLILFVFLLASFFSGKDQYVHSWLYKNVFEYNFTVLSEASPYSDTFISNISYEDEKYCAKNTLKSNNVIILMVESLSSYQSNLFSGIKNWTPNLDAIAGNNIAYRDFYANGFTTEDGEISLLTGMLPIYAPSSYTNGGGASFRGFYGVQDSLPNILKKNGYVTEFITSADLEFANTGNWAESIGFDYIEGHDHPYYDDWQRFHFKSAPDEALYHRVLNRIKKKKNDRKYFIFVKTVSGHPPFINPENNKKSEADAFLYVDEQIGVFYNKLLNTGFFNNGVLFIVGDHHAMVPLKKEEIKTFGYLRASARVPMIVSFGDKKSYVEDRSFQQIDIYNSLKNMVSAEACTSDWSGSLLGEQQSPPKYIVHRRGDNRNIVSVFYNKSNILVKLNGEKTAVVNPIDLEEPTVRLIVNKINRERVLRQRGI